MVNFMRTMAAVCLVLALTACIPYYSFRPVAGPEDARAGASLAVISGLNSKANAALAHEMSLSMSELSMFDVLSLSAIKRRFSDYPVRIEGPYDAAYFETQVNFNKTDFERIRQIQDRLKVDYLYVVWSPSGVEYDNQVARMDVLAQMFAAPESREVGRTRFAYSMRTGGPACLTPGMAEEPTEAMKRSTDHVARKIAAQMGVLKPADK